jgi:GNAT superfamily N-acetyltransferase
MQVTVIRAESGDRAVLVELLGAQLREHDIPLDAAALERAVDGVLADPRWGRFFLARTQAGAALGVAYLSLVWSLEHGGRSAWLEELYVRPQARGAGIGTTMLRAVIAAAEQEGCAAVDLEVEASHARAARLYAREGFTAHRRARWVRRLA